MKVTIDREDVEIAVQILREVESMAERLIYNTGLRRLAELAEPLRGRLESAINKTPPDPPEIGRAA